MKRKKEKEKKKLLYILKQIRHSLKRLSKKHKRHRKYRLENRRNKILSERKRVRKPFIDIEVPHNFSFIDNTNEVLKFFLDCKRLLHEHEKVNCDLSQITEMSSDAIALLAACANDESFLGKRGEIKGNAPYDSKLCQTFKESGFYNHVCSSKYLKTAQKNENNLFHQESNYQVQADIAKKACLLGLNHVFKQSYLFPDLYEMLIESMSNTNNHASKDTQKHKFKWWLYTYNAPNGHTMYTFIDLGVGIFDSLPVILFKIKKKIGLVNNVNLVNDLLEGKIKSREKVDRDIRGKGIPQIATNSKNPKFSRAYIISNDVKINLKTRTAENLNGNFSGTMLFWELSNNDI